jgi:hypothetical protein
MERIAGRIAFFCLLFYFVTAIFEKNIFMKGTDTALYIFGIIAIMMVVLMLLDMFGFGR